MRTHNVLGRGGGTRPDKAVLYCSSVNASLADVGADSDSMRYESYIIGTKTTRPYAFILLLFWQAEEDRKVVLAKRFNMQLQQGMHDSLDLWKEEEDLQ